MIFVLLMLLLFDLSAIALCIVIHPNKTRSNNDHCSLSRRLCFCVSGSDDGEFGLFALLVALQLSSAPSLLILILSSASLATTVILS